MTTSPHPADTDQLIRDALPAIQRLADNTHTDADVIAINLVDIAIQNAKDQR